MVEDVLAPQAAAAALHQVGEATVGHLADHMVLHQVDQAGRREDYLVDLVDCLLERLVVLANHRGVI